MNSFIARSFFSAEPDSEEAALDIGRQIKGAFAESPVKAAIVYATIAHGQETLIAALRHELGESVVMVGCSTQGIVSDATVAEDGFAVGVMAFGGDGLTVAAAVAKNVQSESSSKGQKLGASLKSQLGADPNLVVVVYDPLCGTDVERLIGAVQGEVNSLIVGGGAGQPFGPPVRTYQYFGNEVLSESAVALGLRGPFEVELATCAGTSPTGVKLTVTKTQGAQILAIDGRRALDVWSESTGFSTDELLDQSHMAAWAVAVERKRQMANGTTESAYVIRGGFGIDRESGAITMQAAIPEGSAIACHHRTVEAVLEGTTAMAKVLVDRLVDRKRIAVLGFECAARTSPFLGQAATLEENRALRNAVAPTAPWLGMMAWGEIAPCLGAPAFHNYTYPVVVLTEPR
jgi:hypothetical protein